MKKLKLYLDTSVISHLKQDDVLDKMADTLQLWEEIKAGLYEVVISDVTLEEIGKCTPEKRNILFDYLSMIEYSVINSTPEIYDVAEIIIAMGILRPKSYDDCVHISSAVISECDYIISWNFKHMVNIKTINGVRAISLLHGYKQIDIIQPTMLIQKGDD